MKDWKKIAEAQGLVLPKEQMDAQVAVISHLDEVLNTLKPKLAVDAEPAPVFQPAMWAGETAE